MNRISAHASSHPATLVDHARRRSRGFTLIEVMITVAVIAILSAIALPNYRDYVMRGYVVDATTQLASFQAQMEQYYQDNRTYAATGSGSTATTPPCAVSPAPTQGQFTLQSCTGGNAPTATAFTLTSAGKTGGPVEGFAYSVTSTGAQSTVINASKYPGWQSSSVCWITKKGQGC